MGHLDHLDKEDYARQANRHEKVTKNGMEFDVYYVPKEVISPAFGYACGDPHEGKYAVVRDDLPNIAKRFVLQHELYHLADRYTWLGALGREIRANVAPGVTNPLGLAATIILTVFSKERRAFYRDRFKRGY